MSRVTSRFENPSPNLPLVDRLDGLAEPRDGLRVPRREVIRILDEREGLTSSQNFRRELAIEEATSAPGLATGGSTSPLTRGRASLAFVGSRFKSTRCVPRKTKAHHGTRGT